MREAAENDWVGARCLVAWRQWDPRRGNIEAEDPLAFAGAILEAAAYRRLATIPVVSLS